MFSGAGALLSRFSNESVEAPSAKSYARKVCFTVATAQAHGDHLVKNPLLKRISALATACHKLERFVGLVQSLSNSVAFEARNAKQAFR